MELGWVAARVGLKDGTVQLRAEHEMWRITADEVVRAARLAVGDDATAVEHIGSTAVNGLVAKPIVDLAVRLHEAVGQIWPAVRRLEAIGFRYLEDSGNDGGHVMVLDDPASDRRLVNLHVVTVDDDQWHRWLELRDLLRTDARARERYGSLKQQLALEFADDRDRYTKGKTELIRRLLAESRRAANSTEPPD